MLLLIGFKVYNSAPPPNVLKTGYKGTLTINAGTTLTTSTSSHIQKQPPFPAGVLTGTTDGPLVASLSRCFHQN